MGSWLQGRLLEVLNVLVSMSCFFVKATTGENI